MDDKRQYDHMWKDHIQQNFGRRKGSLWRSEIDWFAVNFDPTKPKGTARHHMNVAAEIAKDKRDGMLDPKGFSSSRKMRYIGTVPQSILMCQPELMWDDKQLKRFFDEHPALSTKGK